MKTAHDPAQNFINALYESDKEGVTYLCSRQNAKNIVTKDFAVKIALNMVAKKNARRNAMRLIDADALKNALIECTPYAIDPVYRNTNSNIDMFTVMEILDELPTIDAVPVVRCRECANAKLIDKNESVYTCTHPQWTRRSHNDTFEESQLFHGLDGNDFCSYGEKMEVEHGE